MGQGAQRCLLRIDLHDIGPGRPGDPGKGGRRVDQGRGPGHQHQAGRAGGPARRLDRVHGQTLAEPDHSGSKQGAALATGRQEAEVDTLVVELGVLLGTPEAPYAAVQPNDLTAPRTLVKAIHVLGHEQKILPGRLDGGQGKMARVGRGGGGLLAAPVVESPDRVRVGLEGLGGGQVHGVSTFPETAWPPEGRQAALGGHPGAREDQNRARTGQALFQFGREPNRVSGPPVWGKRTFLGPPAHGAPRSQKANASTVLQGRTNDDSRACRAFDSSYHAV